MSQATNVVVVCYSKAPIDKPTLLAAMHEKYGLQYEVLSTPIVINATGSKPYYYSLNKEAANFGYQATMTSLEGLIAEMNAILLVVD
jgi:hypothetical protein